MVRSTAKILWMIRKDLLYEFRARQVWPATAMLGTTVVFVLCSQAAQTENHQRMLSVAIWMTSFLCGVLAMHRTMGVEFDESCWCALRLYLVPPECIFVAKLVVNFMMLATLHGLLLIAGGLFADATMFREPLPLAVVALLGNLGFAAVGTLLSSIWSCWQRGAVSLAFLAIPLCAPILIAASEATRLAVLDQVDPSWWRWAALLFAFDVAFSAAGMLLFETLVED